LDIGGVAAVVVDSLERDQRKGTLERGFLQATFLHLSS